MKTKKPNAELVLKQVDEVHVPRLHLTLTERVVYLHLLRHSRLEGKRQLRFSISWLAKGTHISGGSARISVRGLASKGALRLVERSRSGHVVEVLLPEEIRASIPSLIRSSARSRATGFHATRARRRGHGAAPSWSRKAAVSR